MIRKLKQVRLDDGESGSTGLNSRLGSHQLFLLPPSVHALTDCFTLISPAMNIHQYIIGSLVSVLV